VGWQAAPRKYFRLKKMKKVSDNWPCIDWRSFEMTFNESCYALLKRVPKGKVTTYKALASALGTKAYRAVGNAMNKNPSAPIVPCHRVINANGALGGYAYGLKKKILLLESEGIKIQNNKINLEKYGFDFKT